VTKGWVEVEFWQAIRLGISGIMGNKLRSFLTMLGVILGVSAVIILVALAEGSTQQVSERIQSMGSNLLSVSIRGRGNTGYLSYEEVLKWEAYEGVSKVAPSISTQVQAKFGNKTKDVNIEGTNHSYHEVRNTHVVMGRGLTPIDVEFREKVAVIGANVAKELFGEFTPLGEHIKLRGINYRVIGVLESKGSTIGGSSDDAVLIPLTSAERFVGTRGIRRVYVQAENPETVDQVVAKLTEFLTDKYKDPDNFSVFNQTEMLQTVNQVTSMLTVMLGGIAGIALLVGGIGIMNIMLVTVTERTREIGIRKAIGAKKRHILYQFLVEAVVISALGGVIGIFLGVGIAKLISVFTSIAIKFSLPVIFIAFFFAVLVGIVFGVYPANKAARLNPIEALRYE
jgi:putative ABC transport system permease protein